MHSNPSSRPSPPRAARTRRARRTATFAVALLCATALLIACGRARDDDHAATPSNDASRRPNIVLIVIDTLRARDTTPYGADDAVTPELARWAAEGVVFERVGAQSSWTKVSMASLMTSRWPRSHGVIGVRDALAPAAETLAEEFQRGGYSTYAVQSNGWLEQTFGFHQGFERYVFARGNREPSMQSMVWPHAKNVMNEAERAIDARAADRPFFLYLHFMDVHEYAAPPEFKQFGSGNHAAYLAAIRWVDSMLQRLREKLEASGLLDETLLVVASDHAETFGENGSYGHARNVFTPSLDVPLIVRLGAHSKARRISERVRNIDLAPTLLELARLPIPETYQGASLARHLEDASEPAAQPSFASLNDLLFRDARRQESVISEGWSFARDLDGEQREYLFDRSVDPEEDVDLLEFEPAQATRLRALLDGYQRLAPASDTVVEDVDIDASLARKLRALGYLQ